MRFNLGQDILPHEYQGEIYNRESAKRLRWILSCFAVLFVIFAGRTLQLGLQNNNMEKYGINGQSVASRADIVDRNGVVLAKSVRYGNIKLYPNKVKNKDIDFVANKIHEIAPMDYSVSDALNLIHSKKRGVFIKMKANEDQIKIINAANLKADCFEVKQFTQRNYPQRNVFAHVVGFVGKEDGLEGAGEGLEGIEYIYNEYLRENKDPLKLSIDSRVQNIFHDQLSIAMNKYRAKGALGVLMNSSTGELIAMVQLPDFDPNNYNSSSVASRRFKLLRDNFEMGSVFKIFNTALAYEYGLENNSYDVSKPYPIKDKHNRIVHSIKDVDSFYRDVVRKAGKTRLKAPEIMLHSCNTGSAQIALDLPDGAQKEFFARLQFNKPLNLEFGQTETALTYKVWGKTERATAAFGHGIAVTPMHLLLAVNSMTNGGIYIYPTLLKRSIGAVRGERVLDPEISSKLRTIMFHIAEETTAKKARVKGIEIGGKTGTAEKRGADRRADKSRNTTVFTGIFPVSAPQYIILIMLDEPQGTTESWGWKTAAWNAVPTAGAILDGIIPLLFE